MDILASARRLGAELLRPQAEQVDVAGVPRSHIDALAAAGLLGVVAPATVGGADLDPPTLRAVAEELAAADSSTWFVWTQHHTPVRTLARSPASAARERWLPDLATGRALAGVAYTHLRRPGPPALEAERAGDGWRVTGEIAWLTSWGLADVFCIGAQADDRVVWLFDDLRRDDHVRVTPLPLAAMTGTATVRARLDALPVPAEHVAVVEPLGDWRAADAARTVDASPAVFGLVRETVDRLSLLAEQRRDHGAARLAATAGAELEPLRAAAYALADADDGAERTDERLALRAQAHALACRVTAGLVAAGGGRSMALDAPAQRLARTALFLLVQGQTAAVRAATLRQIGEGRDDVSAAGAPGGG